MRPAAPAGWTPDLDVQQADRNYTLQFDLPGVNPKDVKIDVPKPPESFRREIAIDHTWDETETRAS